MQSEQYIKYQCRARLTGRAIYALPPVMTSNPSCLRNHARRRLVLGEAEVIAAGCDGLVHLASENVVALILGEIELCGKRVSKCSFAGNAWGNLRLKQV